MKLAILCDAHWQAGLDAILKYFSSTDYRGFFESREYGKGVAGIVIILMSRDPDLKFKQRVRFGKKERTLYLDVMLNLSEMRHAEDGVRRRIVIDRLRAEIPVILRRYHFSDFEEAKFVSDFKDWLEKMV